MKKILQKVSDWLKAKFAFGYDQVKKHSIVAVKVTDGLRKVIDSPVADVLTALIPGDVDDAIKDQLRKVLPEVAAKVAIAHNIIAATDDVTEALHEIKIYIESLGNEARKDWWVIWSTSVMEALSDGKVSWAELVILTQDAYNELYGKK